ncbi:hypothetical protein PMAYCL1PPCAC_07836, partial [Pristionchus mayeri]
RAFFFFLTLPISFSYKILVYNSKCGHSNINFYGNVADILVEAGHDVTTLLPQLDPAWGDGTHKSKKIYAQQTKECKQITDALRHEDTDWFSINMLDPIAPFVEGTAYSDRFALQCRGTLEEPGLIDRLRADKFDVMITENFDMCGIGISHLIKPKALVNGAASVPMAWNFDEFGLPKAWSYNPSPLTSHLDVHSFWSRLKNIYAEAMFYGFFYTSRSMVEQLFKEKYGPSFPSLTEISSHAAYTIVNSEPLVDFATPTLNRIIYVGGLGAQEPKAVDKNLDSILNLRSKTILISFGSVVLSSQLRQEVKDSIVETVSQFPEVTFIWKYEKPEDDFAKEAQRKSPNLHLSKWIPQNDLLGDPRLTAFITHAGMGSTQETMRRGKPGLFVPCFGDQPRNAGAMERNGLGKVFDKHDISDATKFTAAVKDLIENQSYYENARRISSMIAKKPFSAKEQLIKHVEFAAEFGPSPALRPQSYDMNWIEYHNADIIAIFVLTMFTFAYSSLKIVPFVFKKVLCIAKSKQE